MRTRLRYAVLLIALMSWTGVATASMVDITRPGDPIALINGVNQGDGDAGPPPFAEGVENAINDIGQKYLNFLDLGSGFSVTPSGDGKDLSVTALTFYTANDAVSRDPASYWFSGSNGDLVDGPWTVISSGNLSLPDGRNAGGNSVVIPPTGNDTAFHQQVMFSNTNVYTHYQIIFPTLKDAVAANSMQIGEVELQVVSTVVPIPAAAWLFGSGLIGLVGMARRKKAV